MEINGELYIKGGPACQSDDCMYGKVGLGRRKIMPDNKIIWTKGYGPCPRCEGTKIEPLSRWTADECAEWLRDEGKHQALKYIVAEYCAGLTGELTFTEALRAAVAAVAKERKWAGTKKT